MQINESPNSNNAAPGGVVFVDSKWAVLALVMSGMSFIAAGWAIAEARNGRDFAVAEAKHAQDDAKRTETRADLLQLEVESFKNVLHEYKLPTTSHLPGESP